MIVFGRRATLNPMDLASKVLPTYQDGFERAIRMWSTLDAPYVLHSYPVASLFCDGFVDAARRHDYMERYQCPEGWSLKHLNPALFFFGILPPNH